jgi:hypothetical protein
MRSVCCSAGWGTTARATRGGGSIVVDDRLTVICHFRNEEVYLPYWLRHHTRLFDHGILIDYHSTDRSAAIIRDMAPSWEIRRSRNDVFQSLSIDAEVMDVERELGGWKMCLNVTEFVMHHNLRAYLAEFERHHPAAPGLVTTGFIIQDTPDQLDVPLTAEDLWEQRHFGCPEPEPGDGGLVGRSRLLHREHCGRYGPGRHSNGVSDLRCPPLYLLWYGWCPLYLKKLRNRDAAPMIPASDLARGWGRHHVLGDDEILRVWKDRYLPHCHDLLGGRWPGLSAAVERIRSGPGGGLNTSRRLPPAPPWSKVP